MKKTYITPFMEIENEEVESFLLAGSITDTVTGVKVSDEETITDGSMDGRGFDFDEE